MFHLVSYKRFRINLYIPELGLIYKEVGRLWNASNREDIFRKILRWY